MSVCPGFLTNLGEGSVSQDKGEIKSTGEKSHQEVKPYILGEAYNVS